MRFKMHRVHVWAGDLADEPGAAAAKLAELADAGTDLEYVFCERVDDKTGVARMLVGPVVKSAEPAARAAGLTEIDHPVVMRIEGDNETGMAHRLKSAWAHAGINLHGSSLAAVNGRFVGYVTFDTVEDGNNAARILAEVGTAEAAAV